MIPKLIPFTQECGLSAIVQKDLAPAHAHHAQAVVYSQAKVQRIIWCPNSPDLNMIEPCWPHIKRVTTAKGAPKSRAEGERVWLQTWKELEMSRIQAWIKRIPDHIEQVIKLLGGNEYKEGRRKDRKVYL